MSRQHVELRPGAYADSVALLQVSRRVADQPGVAAAQVAMATALNVDVLTQMGFTVPDAATGNDLVVAVRLEPDAGDDALDGALAAVAEALTTRAAAGTAEVAPPRTTATALRGAPGALALVSVPGAHALVEAMDALDAGHDVMVFSDNVPVEQEVALKRAAAERGLLVMGPDCGTAVVDGVGLGFANACAPGPVAIVAASGTGCQQLLALLDHAGVGVTQALGVGGRDLSAAVGGLSTREALRRLDDDPAVELVVVVSKPPDAEVADGPRGVHRRPRHPRRARPARTRSAGPDRRGRAGARPPRPGRARVAGGGPGLPPGRRGRRRDAARALRRRHPLHGSTADRDGGPWATARARSPTSATTSTPAAGPTR